jgi:hypothetical protein
MLVQVQRLGGSWRLVEEVGGCVLRLVVHSPREVCEKNPKLVELCRGVVLLKKGASNNQDQWMQRQ